MLTSPTALTSHHQNRPKVLGAWFKSKCCLAFQALRWDTADAEIKPIQGPLCWEPRAAKGLSSKPRVGAWKIKSRMFCLLPRILPNSYLSTSFKFFFFSFFPTSSLQFFLEFDVANAGSCMGPQNKTCHPAHHHDKQLIQVPVLGACGIPVGSKACIFNM